MDLSTKIEVYEPPAALRVVTEVYAVFLLIVFALLPVPAIAYLYFFQNPLLTFEDHLFHEIAIAIATLEGLFVTYVSWRCCKSSGEPLLRWLTLGFLGFALVYALHGAFTGMAHHNIWLFLLYGPASRLAMSILLFVGLLSYRRLPDSVAERSNPRAWLMWIALFLAVDLVVAWIANSDFAGHPAVRMAMEGGAMVFCALNVAALLADSLAVDDDLRDFGHVVRAVVARIHSGATVESYVVARPRDFRRRVVPAQLWRRRGISDDSLILYNLQPGRVAGPPVRSNGRHSKCAAGSATE